MVFWTWQNGVSTNNCRNMLHRMSYKTSEYLESLNYKLFLKNLNTLYIYYYTIKALI